MYMYFEMFAWCLSIVLIKDEHRKANAEKVNADNK